MITKGLMSSNSSEWATPQELFNELDKEFNFTLDPCSTHENAKCKLHYTKKEDGLKKSWGGIEYSATLRMVEKLESGLRKLPKAIL